MDQPPGGAEPLIVQAVHGDTGKEDTVVVPASDAPDDIAEAKQLEKQVALESARDPAPNTATPQPLPVYLTDRHVQPGDPMPLPVADAPGPGEPVGSPVVHPTPKSEASSVPAAQAPVPAAHTPVPAGEPAAPAGQAPASAPVVAGTALRADPATDPDDQAQQIKNTDKKTVTGEVEKARAEDRAVHGLAPAGTVVEGIEDDHLWALLRRFDTQINHVLQPARCTPADQPDLRMTSLPDVPFRNDTLKSNFERVIAAIGPPSTRGIRELVRITDWDVEWRRTAMYCTAYFTAWTFGYTVFAMLLFFTVLVCFPGTRRYLFPEPKPPTGKPPSATDPAGEKGDESFIGVTDGMKHRSRTEQAEQQAFEARTMVEAYTRAVIVGQRGRKGNGEVGAKDLDPDDTDDDPIIRDEYGDEIGRRETDEAPQTKAEADAEIGGQKIKAHSDKHADKVAKLEIKRKRDAKVNKAAKMTETGLGSIADTIEILQNAMSPPIPYPDYYARFKLAGAFLIVPALAIQFIPGWIWCRLIGFAFGFGLWGRPIAIRGIQEIEKLVPNWQQLLDMRNSLLSNTPTNAQLILHILRVSEDIGHPIPPPPPPPLEGTPKEALKDTSPALDPDTESIQNAEGAEKTVKKATAKTKGRIAGTFKKVSRKLAGFRGDVAVDGTAKKLGSKILSVDLNQKFGDESPDAFACKLNKTAGHIIIDEREMRVAWVPVSSRAAQHVWDIDDIMELKKDRISVPRMALGWLGGAEVESLGLSIRFADPLQQAVEIEGNEPDDESYHFTSVRRREQLFNRLLSSGSQRWEQL